MTFDLHRRWILTNDGFHARFELTIGGVTHVLSINDAQRLVAELVLAVDEVEPARWGRP